MTVSGRSVGGRRANKIVTYGCPFPATPLVHVVTPAPFGAAATVQPDGGSFDGGSAALTGYSIIGAPDLTAAAALAKGCPLLADGGTVDVYEALPM